MPCHRPNATSPSSALERLAKCSYTIPLHGSLSFQCVLLGGFQPSAKSIQATCWDRRWGYGGQWMFLPLADLKVLFGSGCTSQTIHLSCSCSCRADTDRSRGAPRCVQRLGWVNPRLYNHSKFSISDLLYAPSNPVTSMVQVRTLKKVTLLGREGGRIPTQLPFTEFVSFSMILFYPQI